MICLVQEKAKVPTSSHDIADTYPASMRLQHTGIFFTESGKSLSCLFLLYKKKIFIGPQWGVSVNDQGFYSIFPIPISEGPSLYTFIFLSQELDLKLLT